MLKLNFSSISSFSSVFAITTLLSLSHNSSYAQNNGNNGQGVTQWKTNGNVADSNQFVGTKNNTPLIFRSNDVERLRITPGGNIGIGTSTPQAKLDVNGDAIFRSNFKLPGLNNADPTFQSFLLIKDDGTVSKGGLDNLKSLMYLDVNSNDGSCGDGGVYNDPNPTWSNGLNKIYYKCPQIKVGIGTQNPNFTLHVIGTTYSSEYKGNNAIFNQRLLVGTDVINPSYSVNVVGNSFLQGRLNVKNSSNGASIKIDQTASTFNNAMIFYAEIHDNPSTEIFRVNNTQSNYTPFLLEASGKMTIHNGSQKY